jgi:hypothetical protein
MAVMIAPLDGPAEAGHYRKCFTKEFDLERGGVRLQPDWIRRDDKLPTIIDGGVGMSTIATHF